MKQSIGTAKVMTFVIIFVVITFVFIMATLLYLKAFKVNSMIAGTLEKYEGANDFFKNEIKQKLNALGYAADENFKCPSDYVRVDEGHKACIRHKKAKGNYYRYDILTYIEFGPLLGVNFSIPIRTESEKIYDFSS